MNNRRVRIAYVAMAVAAFGLSLGAGDTSFIAMTGFVLAVSLLGAVIAMRQEEQKD